MKTTQGKKMRTKVQYKITQVNEDKGIFRDTI